MMPLDTLSTGIPALLHWYTLHGRMLPWRHNPDAYRVWISEVMLQQTRIEAVIPHYYAFLKVMPDIHALAGISETVLLKCWEGLGYYSRAKNLQKTAKILVDSGADQLPDTYAALIKLPGIGAYTAGAIASIAFGEPVPAVDGNVMRVLARLTADSTDVLSGEGKKRFTQLAASLIPSDDPGKFNQAMMELGETVCLPNTAPRCAICPLAGICQGKAQDMAADLPVRKKQKSRRIEQHTVFLLMPAETENTVLLHQRPKTGLLAGLYEFPHVQGILSPEETLNRLNDMGFTVEAMEPVGTTRHLFTHIEWQMTGYAARIRGKPSDTTYIWSSKTDLERHYAIPSAFRYFVTYLEKLWMEV